MWPHIPDIEQIGNEQRNDKVLARNRFAQLYSARLHPWKNDHKAKLQDNDLVLYRQDGISSLYIGFQNVKHDIGNML